MSNKSTLIIVGMLIVLILLPVLLMTMGMQNLVRDAYEYEEEYIEEYDHNVKPLLDEYFVNMKKV